MISSTGGSCRVAEFLVVQLDACPAGCSAARDAAGDLHAFRSTRWACCQRGLAHGVSRCLPSPPAPAMSSYMVAPSMLSRMMSRARRAGPARRSGAGSPSAPTRRRRLRGTTAHPAVPAPRRRGRRSRSAAATRRSARSKRSSTAASVSSARMTNSSAYSAWRVPRPGGRRRAGASGAAATRCIQLRCTPVACLIRPPIDSALTRRGGAGLLVGEPEGQTARKALW